MQADTSQPGEGAGVAVPQQSARELARVSAESATPFAAQLARQVKAIVEGLRRGDDTAALGSLADIMGELECFLSFFILIEDIFVPPEPKVAAYRAALTRAIEGAAPALAHQDLVEVADSLFEDLLPLLEDYAEIDAAILAALEPRSPP